MAEKDDAVERLKRRRDEGTITDEGFRRMVLEVVSDEDADKASESGQRTNNKSERDKSRRGTVILGAVLAGLAVFVLLFAINAIHFKPNDMSDAVYNAGCSAVDAGEAYLGGRLSGSEAHSQISRQVSIVDGYSASDVQVRATDSHVAYLATDLGYQISRSGNTLAGITGDDEDVRKALNELKEAL